VKQKTFAGEKKTLAMKHKKLIYLGKLETINSSI